VNTVPAATLTSTLAIPAWVPPGLALASQPLVITPASVLLGLPCQFAVH